MDPNLDLFCSFCGTLVPIKSNSGLVCPLCKESFNRESIFHSEKTIHLIADEERNSKYVKSERVLIKEKCPECGHEGLFFTTAQIRSADEGQTIFYECSKCKYKFQQNA